jgi:hypothetical protein
MKQPEFILKNGTRICTNRELGQTRGLLVSESHLAARKANTVGTIHGVVGGHGGDVYFVAHLDGLCAAVYCFDEFELASLGNPCTRCSGTGIDWDSCRAEQRYTRCATCAGTGGT